MARTDVTDYTKRKLKKVTLGKLRALLQEWLYVTQGDSDKAGDIEDACFYEGQLSIIEAVLDFITENKEKK